MITGRVDDYGRAFVPVVIGDPLSPLATTVEAWIDTGFTGSLLLPSQHVVDLKLPRATDVSGALADGSTAFLRTHSCRVEWFGKSRLFDVAITSKKHVLQGILLLQDLLVTIDYPARSVTLTPSAAA